MEETESKEQRKSKPRSKSILKQAAVISRSGRSQLRTLKEDLKRELNPQTSFELFQFEKLAADICRLAKLYEYDQKHLSGPDKHRCQLFDDYMDRFIRYKNSIEKDIKDGYSRLKELKNDRDYL